MFLKGTLFSITYLIFCCNVKISNGLEITILYGQEDNHGTSEWGFETAASALPMAIFDFQARGWLPDVQFKYVRLKDGCDPKPVIDDMARKYYELKPNVIFGMPCPTVLTKSALYGSVWNIPIFTLGNLGGEATELYNKGWYDTVISMQPAASKIADGIAELARKYQWQRIAIFSHDWFCRFMGPSIRRVLLEKGFHVTDYIDPGDRPLEDDQLLEYLARIKERARIVLYCSHSSTEMRFLKLAYDEGMFPEYVFLCFEQERPKRIKDIFPDLNQKEIQDWANILSKLNVKVFSLGQPEGKEIDAFKDKVPISLAGPPWYYNVSMIKGWKGSFKSVDLYDLAWTYLDVLNETLNAGKGREYFNSGTYIQEQIKNRVVTGLRGKFKYDQYADRIPDVWYWSMAPGQEGPEIVAIINMAEVDEKRIRSFDGREPYWSTESGLPPPDTPPCGFLNEHCEKSSVTNIIIIGIVSSLAAILLVAGILGYKWKKRLDDEALHQVWKVNYRDVVMTPRGAASMFIGSQQTMVSNDVHRGIALSDLGRKDRPQLEVGLYQGSRVAVLHSNKTMVNLTRMDLQELKAMKEMTHDNLTPFVGACTDPPTICSIMIYYHKGSLQNVIDNDDVALDWTFKNSLISDMCNGLSYIHSSVLGSHGNLKSSNCLVSDRWQLKISDFGLHAFHSEVKRAGAENAERFHKMLWTAPELLRDEVKPRYGSKEGDIYSFGIVTHEIVYRNVPYGVSDTISAEEVVRRVTDKRNNPYRPPLPRVPNDVNPDIVGLLESCWEENPAKRPTCRNITDSLLQLNDGRTVDIMESMIEKLEKYATNLEEIVSQRTTELIIEKNRTDSLLYRMLPESVAEDLKQGLVVRAELYNEVTVYFSDIVGFTELSSGSSPIQIVNLLNDLYTMFDEMISHHDVYKVETISDSYMVVSGLPQRNGKQHVSEIANLALDLMCTVSTNFVIRHKPGTTLQLRIGFHTGPCAAGVVGLSMPRYCLFGDTVNMASRMETNGQALKIHLSEAASKALSAFGGYTITARGELHIKGKGLQMTYWLQGRDGKLMLGD